MIEFGSPEYIEGIKKLWIEAFGDTAEAVEKYLEHMYDEKNMLLYTNSGEVCAMVSMLPVVSGKIKGRYIYAVATAERHRGKGLCKALMAAVEENIKKLGEEFAILVPASKSLFEFYEKMGYDRTVFRPEPVEFEITDKFCTAFEYYKIREKMFKDYDLISWDEKSLEYILSWGDARITADGAAYIENGKPVEILSPEIFKSEWKEPFALIKYMNKNLKFEKPYFGLSMG